MTGDPGYAHYVRDEKFMVDYNDYQRKYADEPRESDKVLLRLVGEALAQRDADASAARLLDIGCSTGNLLRHLGRCFPHLSLTGAELAESSLDVCRADPSLAGVAFERLDMLALPPDGSFDIIVANAVGFCLDYAEYTTAMQSVAAALAPGGTYLAFEWLHPFNQDLKITETTVSHPVGLNIYSRPMKRVRALLLAAGFSEVRFQPFVIPIDLPRTDPDGDMISYTIADELGERLCFRGSLYQPWCHLVAIKG